MAFGCVTFGALITACGYLLNFLVNNETDNKISELVIFMKRRGVPKELQRRVKSNLRRYLDKEQTVTMAPHLLASLSPAMQRELSLSMLSDTVLHFPLFRNAQRSFVADLAQSYYFEQVMPGDLVTPEGHAVREVIFVMEGHMQAWLNGGRDLDCSVSEAPPGLLASASARHSHNMPNSAEVVDMFDGAWFGESSLFANDRVYTASIAAVTKCELAVLPAEAYLRIIENYPRLLERHDRIRQAVLSGKLSLSGLKCKDLGLHDRDTGFSRESTESTPTTQTCAHQQGWRGVLANGVNRGLSIFHPPSKNNLSVVVPEADRRSSRLSAASSRLSISQHSSSTSLAPTTNPSKHSIAPVTTPKQSYRAVVVQAD